MTMINVREFLDIDPDYSVKVHKRGGVPIADEEREDVCVLKIISRAVL